MSCPSRSSTEYRHRSSIELSSSLSSTEDRCQHFTKNIDEEEMRFSPSFGNVMLASGYFARIKHSQCTISVSLLGSSMQ
ncbi:hypothetical protein WUBG_12483 [Wuchereria bancrofti]|uniref:Uncharacterized protein n=1 Tax=Wuchereria bancrofti TaxID=6293 RepID=J9E3A0_WUCBA|nr:hypothetical protein WUBG_12483 [Wuchereria bancrofti]